MRRNVAGQHVDALLLDNNGAPVTAGASVRVKKDGGAPVNGVGALRHVENGQWEYEPTNVDTDADHVTFLFTGGGAFGALVQAYPTPWSANAPSVNVDEWDGDAAAVKVGTAGLATVDAEAISGSATAADQVEANIPNLDATVSSRMAEASISTTGGAVDTVTNVTNLHPDAATEAKQDTTLNRLGAWSGTGDNTLLGAMQSLFRADGPNLSDIGGTYLAATDSQEATRDQVNPTSISTAVLDEPIAEPTGIFAWPGSLRTLMGWFGAVSRNRVTQTSTQHVVRNDADSSNIATAAVDESAGTFERSKFL